MWSAPAERSGDGALDSLGFSGFANAKRSRATLASALQNEFFSSLLDPAALQRRKGFATISKLDLNYAESVR